MASHLLFGFGVLTLTLGVALAGILMDPVPTLYSIDKTLFATKTAYDWATNDGSPPFVDNDDMTLTVEGRTCTAIHVNMLMRHGSRNPGDDNITETNDLAKKISENKGPNADGALSFIDGWTSDLKPEDGDMLNALGIQEMQQMGERLGARFKQLLQSVDIDRMEFISSSNEHTKDSGKYFSQGLTNYLYNTNTSTTPKTDNLLLRAYDNCEKYDKEVGDNEATTREVDTFKNMKTFRDMVKSIRTRLDLNASASLSNDDVEYIWEMCAFELMAGRDGTWCLMMNDAERKVSSFAKDLENFYTDSYGNPVSGKIHCVVMKKMYTLIDEAVAAHQANTSNYKVGSFMFGHSNTILGLATTFRLFREPDNRFLRATDNTTLQDNRKFVTATITPMAGNLGFALYACPPNNPAPNSTQSQVRKDTRYAVKFFHNEKGARLYPYERQVYWYDQYRQAFAVTYNQCDLDALCDVSKGAAVKTSVLALLLSMFVSILVIV